MRANGVNPDQVTYGVVISACAGAKEWLKALGLRQEMEEHGLYPNVITYTR